jgi:hypothetical protein
MLKELNVSPFYWDSHALDCSVSRIRTASHSCICSHFFRERRGGIHPKVSRSIPPRCTPTKPRPSVEVHGRWRTKYQLINMRRELRRWTSADVYGRLRMAPRAGFEPATRIPAGSDRIGSGWVDDTEVA